MNTSLKNLLWQNNKRLEKIYKRLIDLIHQKKFRNPLFENEV